MTKVVWDRHTHTHTHTQELYLPQIEQIDIYYCLTHTQTHIIGVFYIHYVEHGKYMVNPFGLRWIYMCARKRERERESVKTISKPDSVNS